LRFVDQGTVVAPENGVIASVSARAGDRLPAGAPLFTIDCRELAEEADSLTRQINTDQSSLELRTAQESADVGARTRRKTAAASQARVAHLRLENQETLFQGGYTSREELEKARLAAEEADDQVAAAASETELGARKSAVETAELRRRIADGSGRLQRLRERIAACAARSAGPVLVTSVNEASLRKGAYVQRFQQMLDYSVPGRAEAVLSVPTGVAGIVEVGQPVEVALGARGARGMVRAVGSSSDSSKEAVPVYVSIDGDCSDLVAGQRLETRLRIGGLATGLVLPSGPYVGSGRLSTVYRVTGATAVKTAVRLSADYDGVIAVLQGLSEGDVVIVSSYDDFIEYDSVRIQGGTNARASRGG
jgi:multidrug resistance efflux pump